MEAEIVLKPIGEVHSTETDRYRHGWEDQVSEIHLDPALVPALHGLDEFSHIVCLFYLHLAEVDMDTGLIRHPRDREDLPPTGIFALRTQFRPNPIGVTTVELLGISGAVLKVRGLDAVNGTPVLDIKPYMPDQELAGRAVVPAWVFALSTPPPATEPGET